MYITGFVPIASPSTAITQVNYPVLPWNGVITNGRVRLLWQVAAHRRTFRHHERPHSNPR